MECAIFSLLGVVLGVCLTLFSKGEFKGVKSKSRFESACESDGVDSDMAKSEQQLMRQWQNLLNYGSETETESYI